MEPEPSTAASGRFVLDTDPERLDLARVHSWLSTEAYWALGRSLETVGRAAANSLNIGAYAADGEQVGYARIVTDRTTFAWLCDVFVPQEWRGHGLGLALAQEARRLCEDMGIRRMVLVTGDAHGVYERVGFSSLQEPERWMDLLLQAYSPQPVSRRESPAGT